MDNLASDILLNNNELDQNTNPFELDYLAIANLEGIGIEQITNTKLRYKHLNAKPADNFKIPPISHFIWFTKIDAPKEVRVQDLQNLFKILDILNSQETTWQHFLWTNCKVCIPETIQELQSCSIQVNEINQLKEKLVSYNILTDLIENKKFGMAADFFRLDILKEMGGIYFDLNYILSHSPEKYMHQYEFLTHTDRGGLFVDVYMIAAKPHHPILEEATNIVLRNFINPTHYVQLAQNSSLHIQELTGVMTYLPFNCAFFKYVNKYTVDFAFPLAIKESYPIEAKKPHFFSDDIYEDYVQDSCENTDEAVQQEILIQALLDANKNEICMKTILGFDGIDGNSWFDETALYVE